MREDGPAGRRKSGGAKSEQDKGSHEPRLHCGGGGLRMAAGGKKGRLFARRGRRNKFLHDSGETKMQLTLERTWGRAEGGEEPKV